LTSKTACILHQFRQLRRTLSHDVVEGCKQGIDLAVLPKQLLRNEQPVGCVVRTRVGMDRCGQSIGIPLGTVADLLLAGGGLVTLLGVLG
jgi:hypothetical protein